MLRPDVLALLQNVHLYVVTKNAVQSRCGRGDDDAIPSRPPPPQALGTLDALGPRGSPRPTVRARPARPRVGALGAYHCFSPIIYGYFV